MVAMVLVRSMRRIRRRREILEPIVMWYVVADGLAHGDGMRAALAACRAVRIDARRTGYGDETWLTRRIGGIRIGGKVMIKRNVLAEDNH
jgi:hypothetical protein